MATFVKRGKKWTFAVDLPPKADGKRNRKWYSGYDSKPEADAAAKIIEAQVVKGTYIEVTKLTMSELFDLWLKKKKSQKKKLADSTLESYEMIINNHFKPSIGHYLVQKICSSHIDDYYNYAQKTIKLSDRTINYHHRVLKTVFKYAYAFGYVKKDPMLLVDTPEYEKKEITIYDQKTLDKFLDALKQNQVMQLAAHLALGCTLRRSEILGLKWSKVNLKKGTITIDEVVVPTKKGVKEKQPKSSNRKGNITAPPDLIDLLKEHKKRQSEYRLIFGDNYQENDLVVCKENGEAIHPGTFSHWFADFLEDNNLPHIRFHDMKHTGVTYGLLAGVDMKTMQKRAGHATFQFMMDTYAHVLESMDNDAAQKINNLIPFKKKA